MPTSLILLGGESPRRFTLSAFNTLGRHPDNSIRLVGVSVSKWHCRITLGADGRYLLRDLESRNHTKVNGKIVTEQVLAHGDEVAAGQVTLRFERAETIDRGTGVRQVTFVPGATERPLTSVLASGSGFLPAHQIESEEVLRADYEKLHVAHELAQKLSLGTDLDHLLQQIVDEALLLIHADRAVILLRDPASLELEPRYVRQTRDEPIVLSRSVLEEIKTTKRALLGHDLRDDSRPLNQTLRSLGIRSFMCVPLVHREELVGVMHLDSLAAEAFREKDLVLFSTIATQAAIAIQNQRLVKKIEGDAATRVQLERLLSPNLAEQVVSGKLRLDSAGSLREVTMLFADIRGFTAMSERLQPQEVVAMLNEYFELMVDVLFSHGGTLDKYVGDEVIALFGAPVTLEDAPLRAVRCALDMQRALEEWNRLRAGRQLEPIEIGIGINTGPVIVGAIGATRAIQYTAIGDAVNVASRLCGAARPGEVLLSQSTLDRCGEHALVEPREAQLKGVTRELPIYAALGIHESAPPEASPLSAAEAAAR